MRRHGLLAFILGAIAILALPAAASAAPPVLTIEPASQIGVSSALAKGTVNPGEKETNCHFDYIADPQFGQNPSEPFEGAAQVPCTANPLSGNSSQPVEAVLTGLAPAAEYHLRLVAENNEGESSNESAPIFKTDPATVPTVAVTGSSGISYTWATIEGSVNPNGGNSNPIEGTLPIRWFLQYAPASEAAPRNWQSANLTSTNYPITGAAAASSSPIPLEAEALGLQPGTEYVFRTVIFYAGGLEEALPGVEEISPTEGAFTTLAVTKPTPTVDPVTTFTDSTATFLGHVNPNAPKAKGSTSPAEQAAFETSWHFEYSADNGATWSSTPTETIGAGNVAEEVKAEVTRLEPNKAYLVKLIASNLGGEASAVGASPAFTTLALAPTVKTWSAGPVAPTQADINAQINPNNSPTTYWFEWGTANCEASDCQAIPATKDASAGEGPIFVYVDRHLSGLAPGTTYHFRVIAKNAIGTTPGPDQTFTTAPAEPACANAGMPGTNFLPDCRGYELVSPPGNGKNGTDVVANSYQTYAAEEGGGVAWLAINGFGDVRGASGTVQYLSRRTGSAGTNGWSSHAVTPLGHGPGFLAVIGGQFQWFESFSPDLTTGVWSSWQNLEGDDTADQWSNLYSLRDLDAAHPQQQLLSQAVKPPAQSELALNDPRKAKFEAASRDFSHIFFQSPIDLTKDGHWIGGEGEFYEYADGVGVRQVGRVPAGTAVECDDQVGSAGPPCEEPTDARAQLSQAMISGGGGYPDGMVSSDGSRILFEAPIGSGQVYLREDAHRTYWINASELTAHQPGTAQPAQAWGMSADGSRIFFTTAESLLNQDEDGGGSDLYMYEPEKSAGSRLTLVSADSDEKPGVSVSSFVGSSADGHYVYFVAGGQLVAGEPQSVFSGLYLWHDGSISYVGQFEDISVANVNTPSTGGGPGATKASRVSPDGHHLLFMSTNDAGFAGRGGYPGYDHGVCGSSGCRELYLYSAESGRLSCVSCDPGGPPKPPAKPADALTEVDPGIAAAGVTQHLSHVLSADGEHVFFTTEESLLAEDTNDQADAYEYDGSTGEVQLISSGTSDAPSYFMDASPDGSDVYFVTRARLVGWDTDQSYDLYDARVGGGFSEPVPVPAACEGESCLPSAPAVPGVTATSSQSAGPGNPRQKCPKGKVEKHGRCVKKTTSKHPAKKHHQKKSRRTASHNRGGGK